jgi:beta-aspartyl-peptidase (threonine type)
MIAPDYSKGAADTVGCVALDGRGRIAAGTSTGGLDGQAKGRVGDSPLAGAGFYAEDQVGGVALSGDGERITRMSVAARIMQSLGQQSAGPAAAAGIERLKRIEGEAGAIVLDAHGRVGIAHNSDHFAVALVTSAMSTPRAAVHAAELQDIIDHG